VSNYYSNFFLELRGLSPSALEWLSNSHAQLVELADMVDEKATLDSAELLVAQQTWDSNLCSQELTFKECDALDIPGFEFGGGENTALFYAGSIENPGIDAVCSWLVKFLTSQAADQTVAKEIFIEWANWCDREEPEGFSGGLAIITAEGYSCTYTGAAQVKDLLREMHSRRATKPEAT
jgi:hypothetical protein